jgi:hypothetical protein
MKARFETTVIVASTLAFLALLAVEALGVDVSGWWLFLALVAGAAIYAFKSNRATASGRN